MKEVKNNNKCLVEFNSIEEFHKYISETPVNNAFERWEKLSHSTSAGFIKFSGTKSFEEAVSILKNGDKDIAKKLTQRIKAKSIGVGTTKKTVTTYDVCGYQASVPRYLQGVPTNMINKRIVVQKQKVIVINKDISYGSAVTKEQIIDESVKAFEIVKKIEEQGVRVVLNIIGGSISDDKSIVYKLRVKNANERLNVSKMAFVMCNPSMLRRLGFRFIEVYPEVTESFVSGYGTPLRDGNKEFCKGEYFIPAIMKNIEANNINSMDVFKVV